MNMKISVSLGRYNCYEIDFIFILKAVSFILHWLKETDNRTKGSEGFMCFLPLFLSCTK